MRVLWIALCQRRKTARQSRVEAYHAAVANQTEEVKTAVGLLCMEETLANVVDFIQFALANGLIDANDVLPDHSAGPDVQVTDFAVAHETLRETDG